jgi:hypothetical protein
MANVNNGLLIGYSDLFDDEPKAVEHYLKGLNQEYLKKSLLHLLGPFMDGNQYDLRLLLSNFFSEPNREFAKRIFYKLLSISDAGKKEISIINPYSILTIFELIYNNKNTDESVFGYNAEIDIFKAILVVNHNQNVNQKKVYPLIKQGMYPQSVFTLAYPSSDIINGNPHKILITQMVKMLKFLDFLSSGETTMLLLDKYLMEFGFKDLNGYVRFLIDFISQSVHNIYTHRTCEFTIAQNEEYSQRSSFIDRLILMGKDTVFEADFTTIKRNPIIKVSEGRYQIIYLPFVLEMVFKGMYFKINEINNNCLDNKLPSYKDFRGFYCFEFSEKILLYTTLFEIYQERYKCFSGEEMKSLGLNGGSDFYMRSGNNVFLFENKDVMIDKKIKVSHDYAQYEIKLREKFYSDKEGEIGIYQIIKNIKKLFDSEYKFDKGLNPLKVTIYPILVVHDRSLNAIGLNGILNIWFDEQLELLRQKGYSVNRVKKLVVVDIDTFIFFKQELRNTSVKLDVLLDTYLFKTRYIINASRQKKWNLHKLLNTFIPFSNFIFGIFDDKKRNPTNLIIDIKKYL